ncbi:AP2/ERF domain-containing protein PFD0985w-like [Aphis craccivora]|uniref:RNA-directed DNA polymerase n=1 Tax=Aphis craccivora TaxID=307492 RepID=A0A6G0W034_APHCR|nr:AP2/ERF domain-containing protein PFD0985w-like [Aphis craccivora]
MPPKKQTVSEEEFRLFREEVERNSQYLVNQLLQKINDNEQKIKDIKEEHKSEMEKITINCISMIREMEQQHQDNIDHLKKRFLDPDKNIYMKNDDRKNSNIEISKPTFYGNHKDQHPIDFLQNLEEYFKVKQMNREEKLIIIRDCLKNAANNWFATIKFQIRNYSEFRDAFIDEFWSREIQIQTWSNCLNTSQVPNNITYREHFSQWSSRLRHLQVPQLSEEEIVKNIASHYPGYIRAILISLPEKTIINAMKVLSTEENRREKTEPPIVDSNTNNQSQRNNNWNSQNSRSNGQNNDWRNNQQDNNHQHNNTSSNQRSTRNNQPQNNRWNNRQENQQQSRESNQQINQVITLDNNDNKNIASHALSQMQSNNESFSPYIRCIIEGEEVELLVDTGATISVLTKEIQICKISKQIFCQCQFEGTTIHANFIQVEGLNERGIIGADILNQHDAQINFSNHTILMKINEKSHSIPFSKKLPKRLKQEESLQEMTVMESREEEEDGSIVITPTEQKQFITIMEKYKTVFSNNPGKINAYECQIRTKPGEPIYQKPYPIPMSKIAKVDQEIQRMLDLGIIETSTSPWSSPMVGVEKKNGDIRICLDARKINTRIIPDRERPMNMEEIMNKFRGVKYLSSIDLTAGYWQCPLKKECREITAFLHKGRNYQYKVLPFGLINSVAEFQKILDRVLGPDILQFVAIYVDDLHITSTSFEEHMNHLEIIFRKFSEHNVKINIKKSHFLRKKVIFLGHVVSEKGITMDPEKVKTIQNFQPPKNKKQVQSFLGFINFYRKYIRDLSKNTEILSALTKKNATWTWCDDQQEAFEEIKHNFLEDIVIQYPDFSRKFFISTDASNTHIGAELFQINEAGKHQTLSFISRTLNRAERNYGTTELELLAIVFACKKFRNYVLGYETHLLTDHQALTFMNSCQLLNARLTRWAIKLQEYNLIIEHVPGKENVGADTLTRYPQSPDDNLGRNGIQFTINKVELTDYSKSLINQFDRLSELQRKDKRLVKIFQQINSKENKHFIIFNDLLFTKNSQGKYVLMIPNEMSQNIIQETHERYGHVGTYKVYQLLKTRYQLFNMYRTIKRITKACELCQKAKCNNQLSRGPLNSIIPERPLQIVSLDLMGPLPRGQRGAKYVLALLDIFSKHIQLYPIKKATTETILKKILYDYIPNVGAIEQLLTDNGTQFHSKKWYNQLQEAHVKVLHTTTYHPESNPIERANREIGRMLRTYCHAKHTNWVKWLPNIEYWLNHTTHCTTEFTPQQIMFGMEPQPTVEDKILFPTMINYINQNEIIELVRKRLRKKADIRNQAKDQNKRFINYQVGQQVLIKEHRLSSAEDREIHKLFLLYKGPYTITQVCENNTVVVEDDSNNTFRCNVKNIKAYHTMRGEIKLINVCGEANLPLCVPPDPGKTEIRLSFLS